MFFSVLTFTFSTGAQATKLLKSFYNSNVSVVVRENEVSLIISSPFKNVVTIGKDTCSQWDVLPELFNHKELNAHIFTIDKIDHAVTAVQSMNKTSSITIAFLSRWDTVVSSLKLAHALASNIKVINPKMVFNEACDEPHQIILLGEHHNWPSIPVKTNLPVYEYPIPEGHYLGMFAARKKINKTLLSQGNCELRFYVDGNVCSHISREPEVRRQEPMFFSIPVRSRVLQMLVAQCTIEKDAVANIKYIPGYIIAEISCSSSFISSIFIPIDNEKIETFLSTSIGYLNDLKIMRQNISHMALICMTEAQPNLQSLEFFESLEKLEKDCEFLSTISPSFAQYISKAYVEFVKYDRGFKSLISKRTIAEKPEEKIDEGF